ncbi:MAG TPA: hypothetical protein VFQ23_11190 [Anaerolineales bacterium]|nr:hypothetical protein [Anaerolineales bacterium]
MNGLNLISCLTIIVSLALVGLVILAIKPNNSRVAPNTSAKVPGRTRHGWQSWFAFISLALVISIWTIPGALFFLIIVCLVRLPARKSSSFLVSDKEKISARRIYTWLLFSPMLTIPVFVVLLIGLSYGASNTDTRVLAALIPWVFHVPLLAGLTSKNAFIFRHTQQGILLLAIRAGIAMIASSIGASSNTGFWIFLFGNGSLWLFGSMWGSSQVNRGECWWMEQNRENVASSEPITTVKHQMDHELEDLLKSLNTDDKVAAKSRALQTFRVGAPETRKRAVEVLSKLGEVEMF